MPPTLWADQHTEEEADQERVGGSVGSIILILLGCGASPSASTSNDPQRHPQAGNETARIVLIDFFVGLGARDESALERTSCAPASDPSELLPAYREAVESSGLIRLKVASVDPAATSGNVAFAVTTEAGEVDLVAVLADEPVG